MTSKVRAKPSSILPALDTRCTLVNRVQPWNEFQSVQAGQRERNEFRSTILDPRTRGLGLNILP